jgi:O-antigen/teichoic acid export membrane protein
MVQKRLYHLKASNIKDALLFGLPMIPSMAMNSIRTATDRFLIGLLGFGALLGAYSGAYQLATVTMFILSGVLRTLVPDTLNALTNKDSCLIEKQFKYLLKVMFTSSLLISFVIYFGGELILGDDFTDIKLFFLLPFIFFFQGIYDFFAVYYQYKNLTLPLLIINIVSFVMYILIVYMSLTFSLYSLVYCILACVFIQVMLIYCHKGFMIFKVN